MKCSYVILLGLLYSAGAWATASPADISACFAKLAQSEFKQLNVGAPVASMPAVSLSLPEGQLTFMIPVDRAGRLYQGLPTAVEPDGVIKLLTAKGFYKIEYRVQPSEDGYSYQVVSSDGKFSPAHAGPSWVRLKVSGTGFPVLYIDTMDPVSIKTKEKPGYGRLIPGVPDSPVLLSNRYINSKNDSDFFPVNAVLLSNDEERALLARVTNLLNNAIVSIPQQFEKRRAWALKDLPQTKSAFENYRQKVVELLASQRLAEQESRFYEQNTQKTEEALKGPNLSEEERTALTAAKNAATRAKNELEKQKLPSIEADLKAYRKDLEAAKQRLQTLEWMSDPALLLVIQSEVTQACAKALGL